MKRNLFIKMFLQAGILITFYACDKNSAVDYDFTQITYTDETGVIKENKVDVNDWTFNDSWPTEINNLFSSVFPTEKSLTFENIGSSRNNYFKAVDPNANKDSLFAYPGYPNPGKSKLDDKGMYIFNTVLNTASQGKNEE